MAADASRFVPPNLFVTRRFVPDVLSMVRVKGPRVRVRCRVSVTVKTEC